MSTSSEVTLVTVPAISVPLTGTANGTSVSPAFVPQLGRDLYITLSGTWTGTVQLMRSTDGGTTKHPVTIAGGQDWGKYTVNCDEVVATPTDGASRYYLSFAITSGTVTYRLAQ